MESFLSVVAHDIARGALVQKNVARADALIISIIMSLTTIILFGIGVLRDVLEAVIRVYYQFILVHLLA